MGVFDKPATGGYAPNCKGENDAEDLRREVLCPQSCSFKRWGLWGVGGDALVKGWSEGWRWVVAVYWITECNSLGWSCQVACLWAVLIRDACEAPPTRLPCCRKLWLLLVALMYLSVYV